jgi:hypothetical protein
MAVERKYERDIDLLLAEEFSVSPLFATWFLTQTKLFKDVQADVHDVYVSRSDATGESDLVVVFERTGGDSRFALHIEDKIDAPLQPEQEARYRLRAEAEILRGDYAAYEVILCSPESYPLSHSEASTFDSCVTYEAVSECLRSINLDERRSAYRANFVATASKKSSNTWTRNDDDVTNAFWKAAFNIATEEFPDLEMKTPNLTKDSTWINFRPVDLPTLPRRVYISFKGDRGFIDLTFSNCLTRLFQPQVKAILAGSMSVHQTGKSSVIRIEVEGFNICQPDKAVLEKVRAAFSASVRLIRFYRENQKFLDAAAKASLPADF